MRFHPHGYEVSSHGDTRYSALFATLQDGRTIEEAYQLDVKGYRAMSNDWRVGKGMVPLNGLLPKQLWDAYLDLWRTWTLENPDALPELRQKAVRQILTDKFATSHINQAHALAVLCTEQEETERISGFQF
jgi:hypothetical protein